MAVVVLSLRSKPEIPRYFSLNNCIETKVVKINHFYNLEFLNKIVI